jgi:hypothetical protein
MCFFYVLSMLLLFLISLDFGGHWCLHIRLVLLWMWVYEMCVCARVCARACV